MSGKTALLLVDCQEDYLAREGLLPTREALVAGIAEALGTAREQGWPVIHVRTRVSMDGSDAMPHRRAAPEVVEGTAGADPPLELREQAGEPVLFKRFFSAFDADGLEPELRARDVDRILIAGMYSHACIQATAVDAYALGFEVLVGEDLVGSYDPAHGQQALAWLNGRAASVQPGAAILGAAGRQWQHRNPCDWDEVLNEVDLMDAPAVRSAAERLITSVPPLEDRRRMLRNWHGRVSADRNIYVERLIRDLGKPRRDAEGEVAYGLSLLDHVASTLEDEETNALRRVRYRPHGIAGLITPWNNPFAIPVAKLAPALGYGNTALWKPALPGSGIAALLRNSLADAGFGDLVALVTGDGAAGQAVLQAADCLSFTGSVPVGRLIVAEAARRGIAVQAELGGSNAAIIDSSADLDAAAADLASAIFSFAGQRCTAIRRVLVVNGIFDDFVDKLVARVEELRVGNPSDPATEVGPVVSRQCQQQFLNLAGSGNVLAGGNVPEGVSANGCWVSPTLLTDLPDGHALLSREVFGPIAALARVDSLEAAIAVHNATPMGLVGALFSEDEQSKSRFLAEAQAGILSINRARPPFAAEGPFVGWKTSGYGPPEHGRWNRDFYTRVQAVYD